MNVEEALYMLDTNGVANELRRMSIKGMPLSPGQCPVAKYLKRVIPDMDRVLVSGAQVMVLSMDDDAQICHKVVYPIPYPSIKQFILHFDRYRYPEFLEKVS